MKYVTKFTEEDFKTGIVSMFNNLNENTIKPINNTNPKQDMHMHTHAPRHIMIKFLQTSNKKFLKQPRKISQTAYRATIIRITDDFLSEIKQVISKRKLQNLYSAKIYFKNQGKINTFLNKSCKNSS